MARFEQVNKWVEIVRYKGTTYVMIDGKEFTHINTDDEDVILEFLGVNYDEKAKEKMAI